MKTIKTAISIDTATFAKVERLSRRLHISRSQFFTQAARHMVEKDENIELIRKINAALDDVDHDAPRRRNEKTYARKKAVEPW